VFERLNRFSEADLDHLHASAKGGMLFTFLATEIGLSSGAWIFLCYRYYAFDMLDFGLYLDAIEPQVHAWVDDVIVAQRELSAITERGQLI